MRNYQLKGCGLKQVIKDIKDELAGVLAGLASEVVSDDNVIVYKIDRSKCIKGFPFTAFQEGSG